MKIAIKIFVISFLLISVSATAQKKKYSKKEVSHLKTYFFNEGFNQPATKKISTVIMKDGSEQKGYCRGVKSKKGQIHTLLFKDSITGEKAKIPVENISEAYLFASGFEKISKVSEIIENKGMSRRSNMKKATTNDQIYFINQSVSLKNKKEDQEFLMQLINPDFDDYISIYHDPRANETGGIGVSAMGMGNVTFGGKNLKSYYVKKADRVFWLRKSDFKKEYKNMFGDNQEFMNKYPLNSVKWNWLSTLVLEYTKMSLKQES